MEKKEITKLIEEIINGTDIRTRGSAACEIIASKDTEAFQQMIEQMQGMSSEQFDGRILDIAIDTLIDNTSVSLPVLVNYTQNIPDTPIGRNIIYVLGEIAYKKCLYKKSDRPDPIILSSFVDLLKRHELLNAETVLTIVSSLKSYAYYGEVAMIQTELADLVKFAQNSAKYDYSCLSDAIEVLAKIHGTDKPTELRSQLQQTPVSSWLTAQIQAELNG